MRKILLQAGGVALRSFRCYKLKNMNVISRFVVFCVVVLALSCESNEIDPPDINARTIIDAELYNELSGFDVVDAEIIGDMLKISIVSSGCDGNTWVARLICTGGVIKTNPPKREVKIEFTSKELCNAMVSKEFVFDLKPLRWSDSKKVEILLTSDKGTKSLLYKY